jgi:hypothetical protein
MKKLLPALCLFLMAAGLSGCAAKKYTITGTVTRGGEKLTWPDGGTLLVVYVPENFGKDPAAITYPAQSDIATSTYTVSGIPPGKYNVAVQQFDVKHNDALGHVYDPGHTELAREVTQDNQVIDIDLPKELPKRSTLPEEKGGKGEAAGGGGKGRRK